MNSEPFWTLRKQFMEKYGVEYDGVDGEAPKDPDAIREQARRNFEIAVGVLRADEALVTSVSDRLRELAREVPERPSAFRLGGKSAEVFADPRIYDFRNYPAELYAKPGESKPNRAALAAWGSWVNSLARRDYDRPLFIVCSADLADSTNISGFAKGHDGVEGWGWYNRDDNDRGALLPQQITEFTNAGVCVGVASVNLADDPMKEFNGFWTGCSTYGSFSYLKYGPMRLFSQLAQDCDLKVGKVLWVAGHSGPETAEDSRTHFGVFAPGVTQLFPEGHVIDLHPWEYNEVPVVLGAALKLPVPLVALHLTRPNVAIPDRDALGMDSHFEAARGAYVIRKFDRGAAPMGTVIVQGTSTTANVVQLLPELSSAGLNVKIVAAISPQLFRLQEAGYRERVLSLADRWDAMVISNRSMRVTRDWIAHPGVEEYSLTSDWDDRWRTGGTVDEVVAESHLSPTHILEGIERFVRERQKRLGALREAVTAAER
jgi:transketolase